MAYNKEKWFLTLIWHCRNTTYSLNIQSSLLQNRSKKLSVIERCSSSLRKSSSVASEQELETTSNSSRTKKISTDVAAQFRKDVIDPTNEELQEQPLIHQTDTAASKGGQLPANYANSNGNNFRKISRLQSSLTISEDSSIIDGILTLWEIGGCLRLWRGGKLSALNWGLAILIFSPDVLTYYQL